MGFIHPEVLWLFVLIVPLAVLWSFTRKRRDKKLSQFAVPENWNVLNRTVSPRARFHKGALILLALSLSVVAAARPYWGEREQELPQRGLDIIFAVDVSYSMLARDVPPTRMEHARTLLREVLAQIPGNRVGIMPFAGDAFMQCPLTLDYRIVAAMLRELDHRAVERPGTNVPAVIDQAIEVFERSGSGTRVIVLLTDGEDHSEAIEAAARRAAENDIIVYALGIGTLDGSPILMPDGTYLQDRDGNTVLSRLDEQILATLANETGGRAYTMGDGSRLDPGPLVSDLQGLERGDFGQQSRVIREERYQWPLAVAFLCLLAEGLLGERRLRERRRKGGAQGKQPVLQEAA